jgi:hypothetical protein
MTYYIKITSASNGFSQGCTLTGSTGKVPSANVIAAIDCFPSSPVVSTASLPGLGGAIPPSSGGGGVLSNTAFNAPLEIIRDASNNLYILDSAGGVFKYDGISDLYDVNSPNFFSFPNAHQASIAIGKDGLMYGIQDNQILLKSGALVGGKGVSGHQDGIASIATFSSEAYLAPGPDGNIYVADTLNNAIRMVTPAGLVSTVSGFTYLAGGVPPASDSVANASFNAPNAIVVSANGDIYVGETNSHVIRKISGGVVTVFAGNGATGSSDNVVATSATIDSIGALALDSLGNVYFAEPTTGKVRMISAGGIRTLAGTSTAGYLDGPASTAQLHATGLVVDGAGNIFVADGSNNAIRKISQ